MIRLAPQDVRLAVRVRDKQEAIRVAGAALVERGFIMPGYIESMLAREAQADTFLGGGIAIPHGLGKDRRMILRTGMVALQLRDPVEWGPGKPAWLVVGIAARADEHLGVLAALSTVLEDRGVIERLAHTASAAEVAATLAGSAPAVDAAPRPARRVSVRLAGGAGLHARPAAAFVEVAGRFTAEITVECCGRVANGKALASLLALGATPGTELCISASGTDADAALAALRDVLELRPRDGRPSRVELEGAVWSPPDGGRAVSGIPASPGVAVGPLFQFRGSRVVVTDGGAVSPSAARRELAQALETAREQLADIQAAVAARAGPTEAEIFRAHQAVLRDEDLLAEVGALIDAGYGAARAWDRVLATRVADLRGVDDERLAARAADLHDVGQRVLRLLAGTEHGEPELPDAPAILVAEDLSPSDTARLDARWILGLCTVTGGPTAHTAIIARSLDIPAVVGAGPEILEQPAGVVAVLDGGAGRLYPDPSGEAIASARAFQAARRRVDERDFAERLQPANLTDGHRLGIVANISRVEEAARAVEAGAEGVGLMRTEFLFFERDRPPDEDEQYEAYAAMVRALDGRPIALRTLDIGGDKPVPYIALPKEQNPFLGVRGLRLSLRHPGLFLPQLRAMYRAAELGPVRILLPMVSSLDEVRAARELAERARREVGAAPVEIGVMIEVPSAALMAAELAAVADFFSIGTNDLTQYVLAMDRTHPTLATHADGLHPAVLRAIDLTVRAAGAAGRTVAVCGGIAGEPLGALVLTGLGVSELSMSLPSIGAVKASMRQYSLAQARDYAGRALACATAADVRALPLP